MRIKAIKFTQNGSDLYLFCCSAKYLWSVVDINKRADDKEDGYQRALSSSRAEDIKRYVDEGNVIAPAIIVSFEDQYVHFDDASSELVIEDGVDSAGWVIDGQHRLRGAELADNNIDLSVVGFIGLDVQQQIKQFVTINREAKGVPTSLYYDLLKLLPSVERKKPGDVAKEKAAAIADVLRKDPKSPFFEHIVVVTAPKKGELSLTNFVRKIAPLIVENKGPFAAYSQKEVAMIIDNYFKGLKSVFPEEFSLSKQRFFQTLGFGAVINSLHTIFSITTKERNGFTVDDVKLSLDRVSDFVFSDWDNVGTGSAAEIQAGRDLESYFKVRTKDSGSSSMLRL